MNSKLLILVIEQPLFAALASAIAAHRTVAAYHSVAGNNDGQTIVAIGTPDGSISTRSADSAGQIFVC